MNHNHTHQPAPPDGAFDCPEENVKPKQDGPYCPEWARCEYCGPMSLGQTVEVQAGLLTHEGPSGAIHPVDASLEAAAPQ